MQWRTTGCSRLTSPRDSERRDTAAQYRSRIRTQQITGINRRGLVVAIPDSIREAVEQIPFDILIGGEAVGDMIHAFDLLEVKGNFLRHRRRYLDRFARLIMAIPTNLPALRWVSTPFKSNRKNRGDKPGRAIFHGHRVSRQRVAGMTPPQRTWDGRMSHTTRAICYRNHSDVLPAMEKRMNPHGRTLAIMR